MTLYITTGFGRLRHLGVKLDTTPAVKSLDRLDGWIDKIYREILAHDHKDDNHLSSTIALYLYGRCSSWKTSRSRRNTAKRSTTSSARRRSIGCSSIAASRKAIWPSR